MLVEEGPGAQWGREMREQRFVRRRGELGLPAGDA